MTKTEYKMLGVTIFLVCALAYSLRSCAKAVDKAAAQVSDTSSVIVCYDGDKEVSRATAKGLVLTYSGSHRFTDAETGKRRKLPATCHVTEQ